MKQYIIEVDDTIFEVLECISKTLDKPIKTIIEDGLFNQVLRIDNIIKQTFIVED